jgi:hypothetical protein
MELRDKKEKRESIKLNRMGTISDGPKASIRVILETMDQNYQFYKLISYSLNTLKSYLLIENTKAIYDNSLLILNSKLKKFKKNYIIFFIS